MANWQEVWKRKGRAAAEMSQLNLTDLLTIDEYDTKISQLDDTVWRTHITGLQTQLGLHASDYVCDVGCGAGALLYVLV